MKVLMVSEYFPPKIQGGGEISAYLLAKNLAKQDIEVHILTSKFEGLDEFEYNEDGIKIHRMLRTGEPNSLIGNFERDLLFTNSINKRKIKTFLNLHNFDIIHSLNLNSIPGVSQMKTKKVAHINASSVFCPKGNLIYKGNNCNGSCDLVKFSKCMLTSTEIGKMNNSFYLKYNPIFWCYIKLKQKSLKKNLNKFDKIFPVSNYLKEQLIKIGIPKEKIEVIPNIVDTTKFSYKETKGKFKILYLGAYIESKGVLDLLKALKDVKFKYECNFYGEGLLKQQLKDYIKKNKLNIKINNKTKDVSKAINKHDVVVMPSLWDEPFGRVAIETMASGKIIIGRNRGGLKDIITNGKTGFLFENHRELRLQLNILSFKQQLLDKDIIMKEAKKYDGKEIAKKTIKLYKEAIK